MYSKKGCEHVGRLAADMSSVECREAELPGKRISRAEHPLLGSGRVLVLRPGGRADAGSRNQDTARNVHAGTWFRV